MIISNQQFRNNLHLSFALFFCCQNGINEINLQNASLWIIKLVRLGCSSKKKKKEAAKLKAKKLRENRRSEKRKEKLEFLEIKNSIKTALIPWDSSRHFYLIHLDDYHNDCNCYFYWCRNRFA